MKNFIYYEKKENESFNKTNVTLVDEIIKFINSNFENTINAIKLITTLNNEILLILDLNKDQRNKIRKTLDMSPIKITSAYILLNSKLTHVFGNEFIDETINNYKINIFPNSSFANSEQSKFYADIKYFSPRGKTRSAIVFNSHNGLLPIHISAMYNKIYSIDECREANKVAKLNLKNNSINNVLIYNLKYRDWINNYTNGLYTSPGKKTIIGNFILSFEVLDSQILDFLKLVKPETIILYSKTEFTTDIENYSLIQEFNSLNFFVKKFKCLTE